MKLFKIWQTSTASRAKVGDPNPQKPNKKKGSVNIRGSSLFGRHDDVAG
jgi:hypothetical protein